MPGERGQHAAGDAKDSEQDASTGWCARLPLMAVGQLRLDHLSRLHLPQRADDDRIEDQRNEERDHKRDRIKYHLVSSFTTSSRPALCDAFTSTRSPLRALFLTHITAPSRSGTRNAPEDSASTRPSSLSRTATA